MQKIYIVEGCKGEYSDRVEWNVAAYYSETAACERVARMEREWAALLAKYDGDYFEIPEDELNAFDPSIRYASYEGPHYGVVAVDIVDGIPAAEAK